MTQLIVGAVVAVVFLFFSHQSREHSKVLVAAEQEKYAQLMQRTILLQQDNDAKTEALVYLKGLFNMITNRPAQALMTDQQVAALAQAIAGMVKAQMANPSELS